MRPAWRHTSLSRGPYTRPRRTPIRDWIERTLTAGDGRKVLTVVLVLAAIVLFSVAVYVIAMRLAGGR